MKCQTKDLWKMSVIGQSCLHSVRSIFTHLDITRVVTKVPLHSLFCHNKSMSELTTPLVTKYYILGFWGQIFVLLLVFVKTQWRFEPLYPYCTGAGLMTLPLIVIFMPPTLKKLEGHIAFGLSVCLSVCVCVRPLTFER